MRDELQDQDPSGAQRPASTASHPALGRLPASQISAPGDFGRGEPLDPLQALDDARRELARMGAALRELGTPVLPIHDRLLVMPLIGHLDAARGAHLMDDLLVAIEKHQASVVILDITGVSVVDTAVANMLIQATRAAKLLGASCVLAGVSGAVSRTLVQLGVNLRQLPSRRDLQDAIAYALRLGGWAIVKVQQDIDWLEEFNQPSDEAEG